MRDEKVLAAIKGAISLYDKIDTMISTQPEELQKVALAPKKGGRPKKVLEGGEKDEEKSSD